MIIVNYKNEKKRWILNEKNQLCMLAQHDTCDSNYIIAAKSIEHALEQAMITAGALHTSMANILKFKENERNLIAEKDKTIAEKDKKISKLSKDAECFAAGVGALEVAIQDLEKRLTERDKRVLSLDKLQKTAPDLDSATAKAAHELLNCVHIDQRSCEIITMWLLWHSGAYTYEQLPGDFPTSGELTGAFWTLAKKILIQEPQR